ncbi:MAG: class I SAM-dependent methyltransferase [Nitrospiria bacterium]
MRNDPISEFKSNMRETWSLGNFGEIAVFTTLVAGHLVCFAGISAGDILLDVGTGTGVVAITARGKGAKVTGLDLTPFLLTQAKENATIAGFNDIRWQEGDVESLPFGDHSFDVVLSQFGHIFAPRPEVAISEMLRVLKPGGRIAFATWPPEQLNGQMFSLNAKYIPPPPRVPPPAEWGEVSVIEQRLGNRVTDLFFERGIMSVPALSPQHLRLQRETKAGPFIRAVQTLQKDPARLEAWRKEIDQLVSRYLRDNIVRQEYLLTRAIKI